MTASYALRLLTTTQIRPFNDADWETYAGVESEDPMIGEAEGYVLIVDGRYLQVKKNGLGAHTFALVSLA